MKSIVNSLLTVVVLAFSAASVIAQCQPSIKIDNSQIIVGQNNESSWVEFPIWLKEGQTIEIDQMVNSISVIEFTVNQSALEFSQVLSVTNQQAVPTGKVWKVEAVVRQRNISSLSDGITYSTPGTHSFTVPSCVTYICAEVWGGGGAGGDGGNYNGGGGGGGGYGKECFTVTPGYYYTVTVGEGGKIANGGTSSLGSLISASGGISVLNSGTSGGAGGTSSAAFNMTGGNGVNGTGYIGGNGGNGGNGGWGGIGNNTTMGTPGTAPGGGGGGGGYTSQQGVTKGGSGAPGKVKISW